MLDDADKGWIKKQFNNLTEGKCVPRGEQIAYMTAKIEGLEKRRPYNSDADGQPKSSIRKNGQHITVTGTARAFAIALFILATLIIGYVKVENDRAEELKTSIVNQVLRVLQTNGAMPTEGK